MLQGIKKEKIGILLPIYNSIDWIDDCIKSLYTQSYPCKIYAIDDRSTDGTFEHIQESVSARQNKENLGWVKNLNLCAKWAIEDGCKYVFTMNSDDYLASDCIELLYRAIRGVSWANCWGIEFGDSHVIRACFENVRASDMKYSDKLPSYALIDSKAWQRVGGYSEDMLDENLKAGLEDWEFWIKMLKAGFKYRVVKDILYYYRVHDKQLWRRTNSPEVFSKLHEKLLKKHYA